MKELETSRGVILCCDVLEGLAQIEDNSVDAIVTDPPYGLGFMGKEFDTFRGKGIDPAFGHWFAGFVDGEGCFSVHKKHVNGVETYDCQFSLCLRQDDAPVLEAIQQQLGGIGSLAQHLLRTSQDRKGNPQARYCISSKADCLALRDLFRAFPLRAKKAREFSIWSEALDAWLNHQRGAWGTMKEARQRLMATRPYAPQGIRIDPYQWWCFHWAREALRVLKPGGYLLAFGGTRTYHRLACAIEDAGFEVRDCLMWLFSQGFPKSLDVSKAIDKAAGAEREVVGRYIHPRSIEQGRAIDKSWGKESLDNTLEGYVTQGDDKRTLAERLQLTAPATDAARQWEGWGTALKPAWEPIVLARKPLSEPTVAANVLKWGTGALNIDACRIRTKENLDGGAYAKTGTPRDDGWGMQRAQAGEYEQPAGRWPANLMLECTCERTQEGEIQGTKPHPVVSHQEKYPGYGSITRKQGEVVNYGDADGKEPVHIHTNPECPAAMLDAQSGKRTSGYMKPGQQRKASLGAGGYHGNMPDEATGQGTYGDSGGASRYFYCAKASRAEREAGLEDLPPVNSAENLGREEGSAGLNSPRAGAGRTRKEIRNPHPTVKPIALMRYLVRLVTPPEGLVLDLFCGSGSTLAAAVLEGFEYIGIDLDEGYCNIAAHRVQYWERMP